MADPNKNEIKKVQIADVEKPQEVAQLDDAQLDKVSGGGAGYGYDGSVNN